MQYFGGKSRIKNHIVHYLESIRLNNQIYIEPFVGGGSIISSMSGERYGYDKHPYLIAMYKELQKGWIPPTNLTKEEYEKAKNGEYEDYLTGFIGFGCSFAGKWFGGYAKNKRGDNFCLNSHNAILRKMKTMQEIQFECKDYRELNPKGALIYCDPPYQGTTQYGKIVGEFDSNEFWNKVKNWSKENTVVVSEYDAPEDFITVWQKDVKTEIRNKENKREDRIERMFLYKDNYININNSNTTYSAS